MKLSAIRTTDLRPRPWIIQLTEREREREMERNDAVTLSKQNCCSFNGSHKKCKTSSTSKKRKETSKSSQSNHNSLCITHSPPPQIINLYIFFYNQIDTGKNESNYPGGKRIAPGVGMSICRAFYPLSSGAPDHTVISSSKTLNR